MLSGKALNKKTPNIAKPQIADPTMPSNTPTTAPIPALLASRTSRPKAHSKIIAPTKGPIIIPNGGS